MDEATRKKSRTEMLEDEGWTRRFVAGEPRLSECVEIYGEAGFDVHLEPIPTEPDCDICPGEDEGSEGKCRICFEGFEEQYRIIFTRPGKTMDSIVTP